MAVTATVKSNVSLNETAGKNPHWVESLMKVHFVFTRIQ